ncbi:TPA: efflux RND transporter periplasmic adaptor subunit [Pseudomonas aeruginosa]|nr:efflux RND transporter periplasmic adaptor subunit [Pseudomonas aeruginosa]
MTMLRASSLALSLLFLSGCNDAGTEAASQEQGQPVPVEALVIAPRAQMLTTDLPGRIAPIRVAEVRARVAGIVQKRHFTEGAVVKEGDLLFTVEPAPLQAALERNRGALARAQAQVKQAESLVHRYEPLVKVEAVSRQEYDDALAALQTARANAVSAQADVRTAQLDLGYATVRAPIGGRIGKSLVSEGSLVGQGETTPMALIQQMDPIYADFTQPANTVLRMREAIADGKLSRDGNAPQAVNIRVDGTRYTAQGQLKFSDVSVDPGTGQVTLRGEFPNPDGILLPGMYVRVNLEMGTDQQAIFVPQRAIQRGTDGMARVMTISAEGVAEERLVQTGAMQGNEWQITDGLKPGDKVIVKGVDKIPAGTPVTLAVSSSQQDKTP